MNSSAIIPYSIEPITDLPIDDGLAEALLSSMAEYGTQLHGRRIWLACSGGRDSLALAALCTQLYHQGKLPFLPQLLHVDHSLQTDSDKWAAHVVNWAKVQQIPCQILHAQVNGHDEQAARQARYDVIRAHINQDDVLILAHHADDQAETILMRLIQGAGVNGLSGMQPWRVQTQGTHRIVLWRPWLTIQRASISAYAKRLKLPYVDDPTNDTGDNVRSGLRRDIMPVLAKYNPNVIDNMARSAQLLSDAEATIRAQAVQDMQQTVMSSLQLPPVQRVLNIDELEKLPLYRQRQLLHHWLAQDEPLPPAKQLIDDVLHLSQRKDHDHQTELFWQGRKQSYTIRRYRQQLYRLSNEWLAWLKIPLAGQVQTLSSMALSAVQSADNKPVSITLRTNKDFIWQVRVIPKIIEQLLQKDKGETGLKTVLKPVLKITPLDRQQRLKSTFSTHPQSGKKLYQALGIPLWLRKSLAVVSVVLLNEESTEQSKNESVKDIPILLLSPFDSWILRSDELASHSESNAFIELIDSRVSLKGTC